MKKNIEEAEEKLHACRLLPFSECESAEEIECCNKGVHFREKYNWEKEACDTELRAENDKAHKDVMNISRCKDAMRKHYEKELYEERMRKPKGRGFLESRSSFEREEEVRKMKLKYESENLRMFIESDEFCGTLQLANINARNESDRLREGAEGLRAAIRKMKTRIFVLDHEQKALKKKYIRMAELANDLAGDNEALKHHVWVLEDRLCKFKKGHLQMKR